jgi:hypothetical protein
MVLAFLLPAAGMLAACSDALIYGETTNVSIATVKLNDNVAQPISANFGLNRTVVAAVPPMDGGGEAANLVTGFKMDDQGHLPFGTKTITTTFASGRAGEVLATKRPQLAMQIMRVGEFHDDAYSKCIGDWIEADTARREERVAAINRWWEGKRGATADSTANLRYEEKYAAARRIFVEEQNIPCKK